MPDDETGPRVLPIVVEDDNVRNIRRRARVYAKGDDLGDIIPDVEVPEAVKARNYVVVDKNETIQEAIQSIDGEPASDNPWVVGIPPGRYAEEVDLTDYPWVSLFGRGIANTIIAGKPDGGDCVISATGTSSIGNLTISPTGRYRSGLEVLVPQNPRRMVKYYELEFVSALTMDRGLSILGPCERPKQLAIWDSLFTGGFGETAIAVETDIRARVERTLFSIRQGHGVIAGGDVGHYVIRECEFEVDQGWAIANGGGTTFRIHGCYIDRKASGRGGISLRGGGPHTITDVTIVGGSNGKDVDTSESVNISIMKSLWRPNTLPERTSITCEGMLNASISAIALKSKIKIQVIARQKASHPIVARFIDVIHPYGGSPLATSPLPFVGGTPGYKIVLRNVTTGQSSIALLEEDKEPGYKTLKLDEFHMNVGDEWLLFLLHPEGTGQYLRPGFDHKFVVYGALPPVPSLRERAAGAPEKLI